MAAAHLPEPFSDALVALLLLRAFGLFRFLTILGVFVAHVPNECTMDLLWELKNLLEIAEDITRI